MSDLWQLVQADHDRIWDLLNQMTGGAGTPEEGPRTHRSLAEQLVALASSHEAAEQLVLWPALRRRIPEWAELAGEAQAQESKAKWALHELEHLSAGTDEFDECVGTVAGLARTHITYEQSQIWPRLAEGLDEDAAQALAHRWAVARRRGPTHPHPHTPASPALLGTLGLAVAVTDRARDLLTGWPSPTLGSLPPAGKG